MKTGLEWRGKPVATTAGRMDALEFAEYRLNQMREVIRKMQVYDRDYMIPSELRELTVSLTCMVRTDDATDAENAVLFAEASEAN